MNLSCGRRYPYPPVYPEYARVLIKTKRLEEARTVLDECARHASGRARHL